MNDPEDPTRTCPHCGAQNTGPHCRCHEDLP